MTTTVEMIILRLPVFSICFILPLSMTGCGAVKFLVKYTFQWTLPFRTGISLSMDECLRKCQIRASCKSIIYKRGPQLCSLYGQLANKSPFTRNPGEYYAEPSWRYRQNDLGGCLSPPCSYGLTCVSNDSCVRRECSLPSTKNFTRIEGNIYNTGAKLKYACVTPFLDQALEVSEVSLCHDNGEWSYVSITCDCGTPLKVENASAEVDDVTPLGATVAYSCNFGYTQIGAPNTLYCHIGGNWSTPKFHCAPIDCGVYETINHAYTITTGGTTFGHRVEYKCINGTTSNNGSSVAVCSGFGNWTPIVTLVCSLVNCGPPKSIDNTIVTGNLTTYGSVRKYSCAIGYENTASSFVEMNSTCKADGFWDEKQFVCETIPTSLNGFSLFQTDAFFLQQQIVIDTYGEAILTGLTLRGCADKCTNETRFCIAISYIASNKTCILVDRLKNSFASTGWTIWNKEVGLYYTYGQNGRYTLTFEQAKDYCMSQGSNIASFNDVQHAYDLGFNMNQCGWVSDDFAVIVLHYPDPSHYTKVGINKCTWSRKWGVFCLE